MSELTPSMKRAMHLARRNADQLAALDNRWSDGRGNFVRSGTVGALMRRGLFVPTNDGAFVLLRTHPLASAILNESANR